ncbi:unnamed protein product [Nesidiocoris tenuis]|uniref:CRAL-TRIO domain-containing protein n=1 Tax=Nesidiocoris tenuis TaxID=355587 RepID=A0A6H5H2M7_9HEMI|nr:unnamed protein product [Nesidiocoris tenuis]
MCFSTTGVNVKAYPTIRSPIKDHNMVNILYLGTSTFTEKKERGEFEPLRMDDEYLIRFLRSRNYKLEPTYRLMVNYHDFRERNMSYYEGVAPVELSHIADADIINVLPYREQTGRRIIYFKIGKWDPSTTSVDDLFTATLAVLEAGMLELRAQILGGVCIFDFEGLSMTHAWNITPSTVSKVIEIMVTSFPMKISAIHVLHESWIFEKIFSMFNPLLPTRYKEICYFHGGDLSSLHKHIEPKYLPKAFGGTRPEYSYQQWFISLTRDPRVVNGNCYQANIVSKGRFINSRLSKKS